MMWNTILPWASVGLVLVAFVVVLRRRPRHETSPALALLQQQLSQLQEQLRSSLEGNAAKLTEFLQKQSAEWRETHQTVGQRLDHAARVVSELTKGMTKVEEETRRVFEVGKDIASLQELLRAPKARGNLGEQFLGDLLAQMLPQDAYEIQYEFKNGERVDAVIKTAHGLVPVDAKFPLENFQKNRKLFVTDIKKHIDDISKKYIQPGEGTFEFALMYVPAENVYYEIIVRDDENGEAASLAALALRKKVIPVSPNTFYAYLNTILLGLRGLKVERFAREILNDVGRIRTEIERFSGDFATIGKHLKNAASAHENAEKRLIRINDRLGSFEHPEMVEVRDTERLAGEQPSPSIPLPL